MPEFTAQPAEAKSSRMPWWTLGVIVVMLAFAMFGDRGILHIYKNQNYQAELQQQLAGIEEVNAGLRNEIAALRADRRHLERMARSQLGMVREDEVVYQFRSGERAPAPTPPVTPPR